VDHLIEAARRLPSTVSSAAGLRAQTYAALFGLLSVTSMRISEVLALKREDVGLTEGVVTVREAKFAKSRAQNIRRLSLPDLIQS
jgi:integrase